MQFYEDESFDLKEIKKMIYKFKARTIQYYSDVLDLEYENLTFKQKRFIKKKEEIIKTFEKYFPENWEEDKFDSFVMKTSKKDYFEKHSQVFFCYGRLSNRTLLLRYGISLEYNKYDHVYLKINIFQFSDKNVKKFLRFFKLPKVKKFKIKYTKFNIDIINFCKGLFFLHIDNYSVEDLIFPVNFDLEIKSLEKVKLFYDNFINNSSYTMEYNQKIILDENSSYNEYFAAIYRIERQRIIFFQRKLVDFCIKFLYKLKNNSEIKFEEHLNELKKNMELDEFFRLKNLIKPYLDRIKLK